LRDREKKWVPRQRGGDRIISRMYSVSSTDAEKFLLLLHVPGARSFNDLLTMDGEVCSTFHNACIQRHLLAETIIKTTRPWLKHPISRCLDNCSACLLPSASTVSPLIRYNCGPLIRMPSQRTLPGHNHEVAVNQALHEVDRVFRENGLSCAAIGLPSPQRPLMIYLHLLDQHPPLMTSLMNSMTWQRVSYILYRLEKRSQCQSCTMWMHQEAQGRPTSSTSSHPTSDTRA